MTLTQDRLDPQLLKQALASMATPVTVVTTEHAGQRYGFTANSFTSVSMDPPLIGVYLADTSSSYEVFMETDTVAVNILAAGQADVATQFATRGIDKFAGLDLDPTCPAAPVLTGTQVTLVGTVAERPVIGDHVLLLVTPTWSSVPGPAPLIYHQRSFLELPAAG